MVGRRKGRKKYMVKMKKAEVKVEDKQGEGKE